MNKLYRSRADSMIAGVCGGLGQYFGIDSTLVRLFFVLLFFLEGGGLILYLVLAVITPRVPVGTEEVVKEPIPLNENPNAAKLIGGALVVLGGVALIDNFNVPWLGWLDFGTLWPLLLIAAGVAILVRIVRGEE